MYSIVRILRNFHARNAVEFVEWEVRGFNDYDLLQFFSISPSRREPSRSLASYQRHFTLYQFITYAPFTFQGLNFLDLPSVSRFSSSSPSRCRVDSVLWKNISPARSFYDALNPATSANEFTWKKKTAHLTILIFIFSVRRDSREEILRGAKARPRGIHHDGASVSYLLRNDSPLSLSLAVELSKHSSCARFSSSSSSRFCRTTSFRGRSVYVYKRYAAAHRLPAEAGTRSDSGT